MNGFVHNSFLQTLQCVGVFAGIMEGEEHYLPADCVPVQYTCLSVWITVSATTSTPYTPRISISAD
jgi:hypothetical protein